MGKGERNGVEKGKGIVSWMRALTRSLLSSPGWDRCWAWPTAGSRAPRLTAVGCVGAPGVTVFLFRWPRPEPAALSPAFPARFSPDEGSSQVQGRPLCRESSETLGSCSPCLAPGKGRLETVLPPLLTSHPPFLSLLFPHFSALSLRVFSAPGSCALHREPESEASQSFPGECVWGAGAGAWWGPTALGSDDSV